MNKMTYTNEYGAVNGVSCSYVKLGRYNKCSTADVAKAPQLSTSDYVFSGSIPTASQSAAGKAAAQNAPVNPTMVGSSGQPVAVPPANVADITAGVQEGYYYADPVDPNYIPKYNVPNYAPINTASLTYGGNSACAGYPNIMSAYGGMDSGNCVTNFITN
jgi:hypothetical protein